MDMEDDDPARQFLDQTVPRHDSWEGREPEEGPARPRHVQHPVAPPPPPDPKEWRRNAVRGAAWTFGPTLGYLAASELFDDSGQPAPQSAPAPQPSADDGSGGYGGDYGGGDYGGGEIGSGL